MSLKNLLLLSFGATLLLFTPSSEAAEAKGVKITELPDKVRVEINGELFTEYFFKDVPRPYCYPVLGPDNVPMTRNYPMKETPGEEKDHPHHRSLWYAHGEINGQDFWFYLANLN